MASKHRVLRGQMTPVDFDDRARILAEPGLLAEDGIAAFPDGSYQIATSHFLPGVTIDMVTWWNWWYPRHGGYVSMEGIVGEVRLTYGEKDAEVFEAGSPPPFRPYTLYPELDIEGRTLPYRFDVEGPESLGLGQEDLTCAEGFVTSGFMRSLLGTSVYAVCLNVIVNEPGGVRVAQRSWVGTGESDMALRFTFFTDRMMISVSDNIGAAARYLAKSLPGLYAEHCPKG